MLPRPPRKSGRRATDEKRSRGSGLSVAALFPECCCCCCCCCWIRTHSSVVVVLVVLGHFKLILLHKDHNDDDDFGLTGSGHFSRADLMDFAVELRVSLSVCVWKCYHQHSSRIACIVGLLSHFGPLFLPASPSTDVVVVVVVLVVLLLLQSPHTTPYLPTLRAHTHTHTHIMMMIVKKNLESNTTHKVTNEIGASVPIHPHDVFGRS